MTETLGFYRNKKTNKLVRLDMNTSHVKLTPSDGWFGFLTATTLLPSALGVRTTDERTMVHPSTLFIDWIPVYTTF